MELPFTLCFLVVWETRVKISLSSQCAGRKKSSTRSSPVHTALKPQGPRRAAECHLLGAAGTSGHRREGPGRMRSPSAARVAARSEQWAGSGGCAAGARFPDSRSHTSRLCFPARPRVSPTRCPTKRFRRAAPRRRPRGRREEAAGGGAAARTEREPPPAVLGGGLHAAIRMGGYCLRTALQAGTAGFAAHRGLAGQPTLPTLDQIWTLTLPTLDQVWSSPANHNQVLFPSTPETWVDRPYNALTLPTWELACSPSQMQPVWSLTAYNSLHEQLWIIPKTGWGQKCISTDRNPSTATSLPECQL